MKKKMPRKLTLSTETLRSFDAPALERAAGGGRSDNSNCDTCWGTCVGCQSYPYTVCNCDSVTCP